MEINASGILPTDGVNAVSRIGAYPSTQNYGVGAAKPGKGDSSQPGVILSLSPESGKLMRNAGLASEQGKPNEINIKNPQNVSGRELTQAEQATIRKLQTRDLHVKIHEQQHLASAGPYAKGGPSYIYQTGPDGKAYAIGGEVQLDISPVPDNPEATIAKAQVIQRSALAPADPSGADRAIAAAASRMEAQARMELMKKAQTEDNSRESGPISGMKESKQLPFQLKAYQKASEDLGFKTGRYLNFQV
ncbi:MAG: hypothetical protein K6U80_08185 [Firmicutes bacterium]|nr:hypothetical protein [Bacillota bacterium]